MSRKATCAVAALLTLASSASALTIIPNYDPNTVANRSDFPQIQSAMNYAITQLENEISNPITVVINVNADPNAFGGSGSGLGGIYSYNDIVNMLAASATSTNDATAVASLRASPDPTNGGNFWINSAEIKALTNDTTNMNND